MCFWFLSPPAAADPRWNSKPRSRPGVCVCLGSTLYTFSICAMWRMKRRPGPPSDRSTVVGCRDNRAWLKKIYTPNVSGQWYVGDYRRYIWQSQRLNATHSHKQTRFSPLVGWRYPGFFYLMGGSWLFVHSHFYPSHPFWFLSYLEIVTGRWMDLPVDVSWWRIHFIRALNHIQPGGSIKPNDTEACRETVIKTYNVSSLRNDN